jgi:hypothetical protein
MSSILRIHEILAFQNAIIIPNVNDKEKESITTLVCILNHSQKDFETLGLWPNVHKTTWINKHFHLTDRAML